MPPTERSFGFVHHQLHQTKAESRRASKPLMEKRRRARINHSLSQLKSLLLDGHSKKESQNPRSAKLEKADILEMTVRHLQGIHQGQNLSGTHAMEARFQAGFAECAREVTRFICNTDVEASLRSRLLGHLASCLASLPPPPTDAMDTEEGSSSSSSSRTAACPSSSAMNAPTTDATSSGTMSSMVASRLVIKQEAVDSDGCAASPYGGVAVALPGAGGHHHYPPCFSSGDRLPLTTPLNLATGSRSSACSSSSSGVSAPASPFSDSESTTSAASDDNYGPEAIRMDAHTFGVIRRAPAAMFCDPVWRPW